MTLQTSKHVHVCPVFVPCVAIVCLEHTAFAKPTSLSVASMSAADAAASPSTATGLGQPDSYATAPLLRCKPEEQAAINELRARLGGVEAQVPRTPSGDHWRDDAMLLRFLRARKFNQDAAEAMYRDVIKWRNETGAFTALTDFREPEVIQRYYPGGFHGTDRDGNAVLYERLGAMYV